MCDIEILQYSLSFSDVFRFLCMHVSLFKMKHTYIYIYRTIYIYYIYTLYIYIFIHTHNLSFCCRDGFKLFARMVVLYVFGVSVAQKFFHHQVITFCLQKSRQRVPVYELWIYVYIYTWLLSTQYTWLMIDALFRCCFGHFSNVLMVHKPNKNMGNCVWSPNPQGHQ